jgi:hypothetical protein
MMNLAGVKVLPLTRAGQKKIGDYYFASDG